MKIINKITDIILPILGGVLLITDILFGNSIKSPYDTTLSFLLLLFGITIIGSELLKKLKRKKNEKKD